MWKRMSSLLGRLDEDTIDVDANALHIANQSFAVQNLTSIKDSNFRT